MTNPYQITFHLKQHTPIIHFQHDQQGATLRATEVKPKLDGFIREQLKNIDEKLYKGHINLIQRFFQSDQDRKICSPYKVHISSGIRQKVLLFAYTSVKDAHLVKLHSNAKIIAGEDFDIAYETPLFANNHLIKFSGKWSDNNRQINDKSEWKNLRLGVWMDDIKLTITSMNSNVTALITGCLPYVFAKENFGLRQSKGFGCFTIENQTLEHMKALINKGDVLCIYSKEINKDWKEKFKDILQFWKLLKAGNSHGNYYKADIMKYFCTLDGTRWEKRKIKKAINDSYPQVWNMLRNQKTRNRIAGCSRDTDDADAIKMNTETYKYVRALLGLAQHNEYGVKGNKNRAIVNISNSEIERFKSPITFKIINNTIYLICHKIPGELVKHNGSNRKYSFDLEASIDGSNYNGNLAQLEVPDDFNICQFLDSPWLGNNFEQIKNWGSSKADTVAKHHGFNKIE